MLPPLSRRRFLTHCAASSAAIFSGSEACSADNPQYAPFDKLMTSFIEENKVPGAALAVSQNREMVYSKGFGLAHVEKKLPVEADSLFRIASISKPITAVAVLQLVDAGRLKLDEPVLDFIRLKPHVEKGSSPDPRWHKITVRHCLQHTGGWDRDKSGDPIVIPGRIAAVLGQKPPVSPEDVVRYMMGRPLDFDPGLRFAYSNLGYLLLGRVIETVTKRKYEDSVRKDVLAPLGITHMQLGRALPEHRARGEVSYYDSKKATGICLYPPRVGERVPFPDGAANFEGYGAHGAWIASAVDLVNFASAFDTPSLCPILSRAAIQTMWQRPHGRAGSDEKDQPLDSYYGCGWSVRPYGRRGQNTWHGGYISGTSTLLVRRLDGLNWAVLFNTERNPAGKVLANLIDPLLHQAADEVFA
jgi:CubicO group peptidase (beta-lactamase class C family)